MKRVKLPYVDCFKDRHGTQRYYFRRPGGKRIALPNCPGTETFKRAYQKALTADKAGHVGKEKAPRVRGEPGTFDRLLFNYYLSSDYLRLAASTKVAYRRVMDRLIQDENLGHRMVADMGREHVKMIFARRAATPGAANDILKKIRLLLHFAIDSGWRSDDPTTRIRKFESKEFHTWTEEEIAQFEARWPIGTRERTAFALLLFTGQRAGDVAKMSWADVDGPLIRVVQQKTKAKLYVPMHPDLTTALSAWPRPEFLMLTTSFGKQFTSGGFSNFMAKRIEAAGLPGRCVTHGLRKAAARRLAEAGCSASEIAAITGHATLSEVQRYTKAAEQKKLALAAVQRLTEHRANKRSQTS